MRSGTTIPSGSDKKYIIDSNYAPRGQELVGKSTVAKRKENTHKLIAHIHLIVSVEVYHFLAVMNFFLESPLHAYPRSHI